MNQMKSLVWRQMVAVVAVVALFLGWYYIIPQMAKIHFLNLGPEDPTQTIDQCFEFILAAFITGIMGTVVSIFFRRYRFTVYVAMCGLAIGVLSLVAHSQDSQDVFLRTLFGLMFGLGSMFLFLIKVAQEIKDNSDLLVEIKPQAKVWLSLLTEIAVVFIVLDVFRFFVVK